MNNIFLSKGSSYITVILFSSLSLEKKSNRRDMPSSFNTYPKGLTIIIGDAVAGVKNDYDL